MEPKAISVEINGVHLYDVWYATPYSHLFLTLYDQNGRMCVDENNHHITMEAQLIQKTDGYAYVLNNPLVCISNDKLTLVTQETVPYVRR